MSKDDSGLDRRNRRGEFSQVVSPNTPSDRRRRNSVPLPPEHGGAVLPMLRHYQPPAEHGGQDYWYHVTTPQNFQLMQQSGGLLPSNLQPRAGTGLDASTGRGNDAPWSAQVREASNQLAAARLEQQFDFTGQHAGLLAGLVRDRRTNLTRLAREGSNRENLYMSASLGSTQDYLASRPFMTEGAHILRVPRSGTRGFVQDVQGKRDDYRSLGRVISSRHIEHAALTPEQVGQLYDRETRQFARTLQWQPMRPAKAQPIPFQWTSGGCSPEARKRHGPPGPGRGGDGGGTAGGTIGKGIKA